MASPFSSIGAVAFPRNPMYFVGKHMEKVNAKFTVQTTGANGDQYILAGPLDINDRISRIYTQKMAALTSANNANLGFYYKNSSGVLTVVKASGGNELWSGVDLTSAVTTFSDVLTGKNGSLDNTKAIRDLLSYGPDQGPAGGIFLVLTLPTANSAGGVVDLDIEIEPATTR